ncbi:MAG: Hpt domain-containing protein, partial [Spirochaetes bacterium]|nr:Hpt domain-containing protein [Spirochaetota bacterium]
MSENDKYVETYKNEAEELLTEIEHAVLDLEEDAGNRDAIDRLFRAMHTIKGSGAMFGFDDIASFTHHIETVLDKVRNDEIVVNKKLTDLVLASRDQLYEMLYNTEYVDEEAQQKIIKELLSLLPDEAGQKMRINADSSVREEGTLSAKAVIYTYTIEFRPKSGIMMSGMDPVLLLDELRELGECCIQVDDSRLPRLDVFDPQYFYLGWTITLKTTANINIIKDVFIFLDADNLVEIKQIASNEKDVLHPSEVVSKGTIFPGKDRSQKEENDVPRLGEILVEHGVVSMKNLTDALDKQKKLGEILVEDGLIEKDQLSGALKEQSSLFRKQDARRSSGIRVPSERLDKLINLVGELVITQARLTQESGRINDTKLNIPVENIDRLTSELRD